MTRLLLAPGELGVPGLSGTRNLRDNISDLKAQARGGQSLALCGWVGGWVSGWVGEWVGGGGGGTQVGVHPGGGGGRETSGPRGVSFVQPWPLHCGSAEAGVEGRGRRILKAS